MADTRLYLYIRPQLQSNYHYHHPQFIIFNYPQPPMLPEINDFLKQLLKDAGQTGFSKEVEEQMRSDLSVRLEDRLILAAMEKLTPPQQDDLSKMAERGETPEAMRVFMEKNIPNYEQVFAQAMEDFREVYLGL